MFAGQDYPIFAVPPPTSFLCDDRAPGYYADKECSTPSTVPLGLEVAPSLGGSRFHVNMLKDKYRAERNKGVTNIFIDYSSIFR